MKRIESLKKSSMSIDTIRDVVRFWDTALEIIYNRQKLVSEFKKIIKEHGIKKKSNILDVSVGTGFLALDIKKDGYQIDINDTSEKMLRLLQTNAKSLGISSINPTNISWQLLSSKIDRRYDLLLCRGNSLVYVNSWHRRTNNIIAAKEEILLSLQNFYDLLKPNGLLWIDITSDKEISEGPKVSERFSKRVNGENVEMIWDITHDPKKRIRIVEGEFMFRDTNYQHTFYSYYMTSSELTELLQKIGFKKVERITVKNEIYTILIARK